MLFKILQYIRGYLCIRVTGYSAERFLNACRYRQIKLWDLKPLSGAYEMNISIRGFKQIKPVLRKTGTRVVIVRRIGFPFFLYRYRRRKLFFAGAGLCLLFIFALSKFVWNIDIRGNLTRTDETLIEFLSSKDIKNGMLISDVDCARIVKDIRKEYDDIIWVSASIEGTRLIIQVKENEDSIAAADDIDEASGVKTGEDEETEETTEPKDIVADTSCTITSIITRKGVPQVQPGAQVEAGQLLVSGQVPVNNDAGEITGYQYQESDADIRGQAFLEYKDTQSLTYEQKIFSTTEKKEYFFRLFGYRIWLGSVKNDYENVEIYSEETRFQLSENFYLPISYGHREAHPYKSKMKAYKKEEIQRILTERFLTYCEDLEKKGVEIIENDVKIYTGSKEAEARGTLTVVMNIGTSRPAQPLEAEVLPEENEQSGEEMNGNDGSSD